MKTGEAFIDEADLEVVAGSGGDGCVHLRREKFAPRGLRCLFWLSLGTATLVIW